MFFWVAIPELLVGIPELLKEILINWVVFHFGFPFMWSTSKEIKARRLGLRMFFGWLSPYFSLGLKAWITFRLISCFYLLENEKKTPLDRKI